MLVAGPSGKVGLRESMCACYVKPCPDYWLLRLCRQAVCESDLSKKSLTLFFPNPISAQICINASFICLVDSAIDILPLFCCHGDTKNALKEMRRWKLNL